MPWQQYLITNELNEYVHLEDHICIEFHANATTLQIGNKYVVIAAILSFWRKHFDDSNENTIVSIIYGFGGVASENTNFKMAALSAILGDLNKR